MQKKQLKYNSLLKQFIPINNKIKLFCYHCLYLKKKKITDLKRERDLDKIWLICTNFFENYPEIEN